MSATLRGVEYASCPRRALALGCLLLAGVAAGCGGGGQGTDAVAPTVEVAASNTAEGRFPDEELVPSQEEAAEAAETPVEEASSPAPPEPLPVEAAPAVRPPAPVPPSPTEPAAAPSNASVGIPAGGLAAGRYLTATFQPQFSLEVDEGWVSFQSELEDFVALSPEDDFDLTIAFLSPNLTTALIDDDGEYTDQDPSEENLLDPNEFDFFDWIHEHAHYDAGEIRSELLAGRAVASFEATLTSGYAWQDCFDDCALLVATSDGELLAQEVGYRERLYSTKVGDLKFVISIAAPEGKFDAFVPRAVELLSTLELVADAEEPAEPEQPAEPAPAEPAPTEPAPAPSEPPPPPSEPDPADDSGRLPPAPLES